MLAVLNWLSSSNAMFPAEFVAKAPEEDLKKKSSFATLALSLLNMNTFKGTFQGCKNCFARICGNILKLKKIVYDVPTVYCFLDLRSLRHIYLMH